MQNAMKNIYLQIAALDNLNADEEFKNIVENHKVYIPFLYWSKLCLLG